MRVLIGIPAYNEERSIAPVLEKVHDSLPNSDIVVVDDGSSDRTPEIVRKSAATLVSLPCNLGYGYAVETILRYALRKSYDAVVLIDADGQHDPAYLPGFLAAFEQCGCDVLIGSRYVLTQNYAGNPFGRRVGMALFSRLTQLLTHQRIYDTTSGMKAIRSEAMITLLRWYFIDFHAEAIVYLSGLGFSIEEYPISVEERKYGQSMYSLFSHLWYPLSVILMIVVGLIQSSLYSSSSIKKGQ